MDEDSRKLIGYLSQEPEWREFAAYLKQNPDYLGQTPGLRQFLEHSRVQHEENARLEAENIKDALTGLYNFKHYQAKLEEEVARALRGSYSITLILDDLDHFKAVNDTYGHAVGNEVLRRTARIKLNKLRKIDSAYRIGGEEGAALLPQTNIDGATRVAELIRNLTREMSLEAEVRKDLEKHAGRKLSDAEKQHRHRLEGTLADLSGKPELRITLSQGIGVYPDTDILTPAGLERKTDQALYLAKAAGRDCARTIYDLERENGQ